LEREFADAVAPFGVFATDPNALDSLMQRAAEHRLRRPEVAKKKQELKQIAPNGLNPLHAKIVELETRLGDFRPADSAEQAPLPAEQEELETLGRNLKIQVDAEGSEIELLDAQITNMEVNLSELRKKESEARADLATCKATEKTEREALGRLPSEWQIDQRVAAAMRAVEEAQSQLTQTELTSEESTIEQRLSESEEAVR